MMSDHTKKYIDLRTALSQFKKHFSCELPVSYETYLLAGSPWQSRLHTVSMVDPRYFGGIDVNELYVLDQRHSEGSSLFDMNSISQDREEGDGIIPEGAIAICNTGSCDDILLFVRGPRDGQVWLKSWFTLAETGVDNPEDDLLMLTRTFDEFLALVDEPPVSSYSF